MAAKKKKEEIIDYRDHLRVLKEKGPQHIYILRGEEEYLRDSFLAKLRDVCVPEGLESFNYRRLDGPKLNMDKFSAAAEALPFLGERTFCEIHDAGRQDPARDRLSVFGSHVRLGSAQPG